MIETPRILVVDDQHEVRLLFRHAAGSLGLPVDLTIEPDGRLGLERVAAQRFDLVVADFRMPHASGLQVLAAARVRNPRGYRVLMTAYDEVPAAHEEVLAAGVDAYLQKPLRLHDVQVVLRAFATEDRWLLAQWRDEARETQAAGLPMAREAGRRPRLD